MASMAGLPFELLHFFCLSVLSATDHFSRVELVRHVSRVTPVFVLKSVDKTWSWKMRKQCSALNELRVLRQATRESGPVPALIGSFLSGDMFHLVLEHASGGDLYSLLEEHPQGLEERFVRSWTAEAAEAIAWLHERGWCHRDIKPNNLLLRASGQVVLTDFGSVARLDEQGYVCRDDAQTLVGTPDYIAPEALLFAEKLATEDVTALLDDQLREPAYSSKVDWWALGVTVYELLCGQTPFFAESIPETYERIVQHQLTLSFNDKISADAQGLLRLLLTEANERAEIQAIRKSAWLRSEAWGRFSESGLQRVFVPRPFDPTKLSSPFSAHHQTSGANAFDFTAFFSSPGLSVLRATSHVQKASDDQQAQTEYWSDAITLPDPSFSISPQEARASSGATAPRSSSYETPRLQRNQSGSSRPLQSTMGRATSSKRKGKRAVEGIEAWREMADHAWSVGRHRQQHERERRPSISFASHSRSVAHIHDDEQRAAPVEEDEELRRLQARHERLQGEISAIERQYRSLFSLAAVSGTAQS